MRIKKSTRPSRISSPLIKLIEMTLRANLSKWFNVRNKFNQEKITLISQSKEFANDIQKTRGNLRIPKLDPEEDHNTIPVLEGEIEDSSWLHGQPDNYAKQFNERIKQILDKYGLSTAFTDWVEWWVLYNRKPLGYPYFFVELMGLIKNNPKELERIGLTTNEKQMAKTLIASWTGVKRRPAKETGEEYKTIRQRLNKILVASKNKQRVKKQLKSALATLRVGKQRKNRPEKGVYLKYGSTVTYADIVPKIFNEETEFSVGGDKLINRLRKQKQRLLQQNKFLTNKLKK